MENREPNLWSSKRENSEKSLETMNEDRCLSNPDEVYAVARSNTKIGEAEDKEMIEEENKSEPGENESEPGSDDDFSQPKNPPMENEVDKQIETSEKQVDTQTEDEVDKQIETLEKEIDTLTEEFENGQSQDDKIDPEVNSLPELESHDDNSDSELSSLPALVTDSSDSDSESEESIDDFLDALSPEDGEKAEGGATKDSSYVFTTLKVKQLDGSSFTLKNLNSSMTVLDIKKRIHQAVAIDIPEQRIIYRGKVLKNENTVEESRLEDDSWIHLVKTPVQQNQQNQTNNTNSETNEGLNVERLLGDGSGSSIGESMSRFLASALRSGSNTGGAVGGNAGGTPAAATRNILEALSRNTDLPLGNLPRSAENNANTNGNTDPNRRRQPTLPSEGSLEHIHQGFATLDTILDNINNEEQEQLRKKKNAEAKVSLESLESDDEYFESLDEETENETQLSRKFIKGQWVDVLDTVNQWLEATIMHVSTDGKKVHIHYNAWGERWDEVLDANSNRIAPFRTKTRQGGGCKNLSATPVAWVDSAPTVCDEEDMSNLHELLPKTYDVLSESVLPLLKEVCTQDFDRNDMKALHERNKKILQLAPVLDRMGRALSDIAPKLADRPSLVRRKRVLKLLGPLSNSTINIVNQNILPYGLLLPVDIKRSNRREEREELMGRYGYDSSYYELVQDSDGSVPGRNRNLDIHIHAIVTPLPVGTNGNDNNDNGTGNSSNNTETSS